MIDQIKKLLAAVADGESIDLPLPWGCSLTFNGQSLKALEQLGPEALSESVEAVELMRDRFYPSSPHALPVLLEATSSPWKDTRTASAAGGTAPMADVSSPPARTRR